MVKFEPRTKYNNSHPPGSTHTYLSHLYYRHKEAIPLALFNEHRFAFYFWALWNEENNLITPTLITLDWHQDLYTPDTQEELKDLNIKDTFELSFFSWGRLNPANDDHIKSAMYRNIIGDAIVICKQGVDKNKGEESLIDMYGNKHIIKKFKFIKDACDYLYSSSYEYIYFDIDLDYFTIDNLSTNSNQRTTFIKEAEIKNIINPNSDFMHWIFEHIKGFTIALEPNFTGGFMKSMRLYSIIEKALFTGSILRNKTT